MGEERRRKKLNREALGKSPIRLRSRRKIPIRRQKAAMLKIPPPLTKIYHVAGRASRLVLLIQENITLA